MPFSINTNISSLQAQENLRVTSDLQTKTINRVTSGLRIVQSGDDAAGLAVANSIRSDIAVLSQGVRNANDGLSQLQIIDGGINNISKLLDRARTLATQSASGTFTGDRSVLNNEFQSVITEIDRQAQAVGLNTGGLFAKALSVFVGGGKTSNGIGATTNGSVALDLSASTVDSQSLGLSGVRAASVAGTDLSTSSTTSVQSIVNDTTNSLSVVSAGFSDFFFKGAGFSDASKIKVSVNLATVTNTATLASALNDAIATAGNGTSASATAFKNANIRAVVVTDKQVDGTVKERIGFISATGAFQVEAGDRLSNALLGNTISGAATGKSLGSVFVSAATSAATAATQLTTGSGAANILVRVQGAGLTAPVDLTVSITRGTTTAQGLYTALSTAVAGNATLVAAGITVDAASAGNAVVFRAAKGGRLDIQVAGDQDNFLGSGTFQASSATATSFDYTSITGSAVTVTTSSSQTFEFSLAGGAKTTIAVGPGSTFSIAGTATADAVNALNAAFASNTTLNGAGFQASVSGSAIAITNTTGTSFRLNAVANTNGVFGFGSATSNGGGIAFTANYNDALYSSVTAASYTLATTNNILAFSVGGAASTTFSITTTGGTRTIAQVVTDLNTGFGTNATAAALNNNIVISAASGTKFALATSSNSILSTVGFSTQQSNFADAFTVNSGGAYTTGTGTSKDVLNFSAIQNGAGDQTVTLTALDSNGLQRSLSVLLRNDGTARNARTVDEAITTINSALQASADTTLKKIVAVKEQSADGTKEGIRFLSTVTDFRVSLGQSALSTVSARVGIFDGSSSTAIGQGVTNSAAQSSGGSAIDISSLSSAQSSVDALASASAALGVAQAVIGRGQNQFNYAVNLASSQLTNYAASESRIRDADLAQEAANLTKAQVSIQAGVAALAQANSAPQAILALLRG